MNKKQIVFFILKKLLRMITLLIGVSVVTFILMANSPIDPIQAYLGQSAGTVSTEQREEIKNHWGLNDPPLQRYLKWANNLLHGDLGTSMIYRLPVEEVIGIRFMASLPLMASAWIISGVLGVFMGVVSGGNQGKSIDKLIKSYCYILASTPVFWIGLLLLMIFSVGLGWFPIGLSVPVGVLAENVSLADNLSHLILPAITLSVVGVASVALHTRQKMVEVMESEYVLFAKARGETKKAIVRNHALRNVAIPAVNLQFLAFSELFAGAILAEQVFSYPGLGQATVSAGLKGDLPLLMGITLFMATFVFLGNLIADIINYFISPKTMEVEKI